MKLFENLELTKRVFIPLTVFAGLFFAAAQITDIENIAFFLVKRSWFLNSALVCLFILVSIFLLELLYFLFRKIPFLNYFLGFILTVIRKMLQNIIQVWIFIAKPFLTPVLKAILIEEDKSGLTKILRNKWLGRRDDDDYFPQVFDTKNITILCNPVRDYSRWRLGVKFSEDNNFPTARYDKEHDLFHLTKDENNSNLSYHLYKAGEASQNYVRIIENYSGQPIKIEVKTDGVTKMRLYDLEGNQLGGAETKKFTKMQIFAWADGLSDFEIEVKIISNKASL